MSDRREEILSAIFEVLQSVEGFTSCVRNRDQLDAAKRPALFLLDGDEEAKRDADGRNRIAASLNRVVMRPEIHIALDSRKTQNISVGQDLNALRAAVVKAVLTDEALVALCDNIFYAGSVTDLGKDRQLEGQMAIMIELTYILRPLEL